MALDNEHRQFRRAAHAAALHSRAGLRWANTNRARDHRRTQKPRRGTQRQSTAPNPYGATKVVFETGHLAQGHYEEKGWTILPIETLPDPDGRIQDWLQWWQTDTIRLVGVAISPDGNWGRGIGESEPVFVEIPPPILKTPIEPIRAPGYEWGWAHFDPVKGEGALPLVEESPASPRIEDVGPAEIDAVREAPGAAEALRIYAPPEYNVGYLSFLNAMTNATWNPDEWNSTEGAQVEGYQQPLSDAADYENNASNEANNENHQRDNVGGGAEGSENDEQNQDNATSTNQAKDSGFLCRACNGMPPEDPFPWETNRGGRRPPPPDGDDDPGNSTSGLARFLGESSQFQFMTGGFLAPLTSIMTSMATYSWSVQRVRW